MKGTPVKCDSFLMSSNAIPFTSLKYQLVYQIKENKKYLKSFNILLGNKTLKKYYFDALVLLDENVKVEELIFNRIMNEKEPVEVKPKSSNRPKKKVDSKARSTAAADLLSTFGLQNPTS
jgi:hypothetical protein